MTQPLRRPPADPATVGLEFDEAPSNSNHRDPFGGVGGLNAHNKDLALPPTPLRVPRKQDGLAVPVLSILTCRLGFVRPSLLYHAE